MVYIIPYNEKNISKNDSLMVAVHDPRPRCFPAAEAFAPNPADGQDWDPSISWMMCGYF